MSINKSEYKIRLRGFVEVLRILAGQSPDTQEAKLTIHSDGRCELNLGDHYGEILTAEQLAKRLDVAVEAHYDDMELP